MRVTRVCVSVRAIAPCYVQTSSTHTHTHTHTHTTHFTSSAEAANATNRIIFLTDLQSTCDSVNDEKRLLSTIRSNADAGIYTTVVGIGMVRAYVQYVCVYACYGKALHGCYVGRLFGWLRMWYWATRGRHCLCVCLYLCC